MDDDLAEANFNKKSRSSGDAAEGGIFAFIFQFQAPLKFAIQYRNGP